MNKRIDGRTAKGLRVRQRVHERLLTAYIDLIRHGSPSPTAIEIARRAALSPRVIFNHFPDLRSLRLKSFRRILSLAASFFSEEVPDRGSAAERLDNFVRKHAARLEYVNPVRRTVAMVEGIDPDVAQTLTQARFDTAHDLERALGPTLDRFSSAEKRRLLTTLHVVCSWSSWDTLRRDYRLSPLRARAIMAGAALAVLAAAEQRGRRGSPGARRRQSNDSVQ
jgi:AcrR family transcriptional regulator